MGKRNIVVTGGAGYIGAHTCMSLYERGITPVVYDNLSRGHRDFVKWGPLVEGDLADTELLRETLIKYKPEAVLHFAAFAYVGESVADPKKYYSNNVTGSINVLNAMLDAEVSSIIFSSTCATYGIPTKVPIGESQIQQPINPYGMSKLFIERIIQDYSMAYGIKHVMLRYFNAAGASDGLEIGEHHEPETHLIPLVLDVALGRKESIMIFGTDYDTPDGTCIRDYIHVDDLALAHVMATDYLSRGGRSMAFNLGSSKGFSVKEIIDTAERVTGQSITAIAGEKRDGDPPVLIADIKNTVDILGWRPRSSDLESIISSAWRWHLKRFSKA
jgi:UDP-glucose-4-epimerase GalE